MTTMTIACEYVSKNFVPQYIQNKLLLAGQEMCTSLNNFLKDSILLCPTHPMPAPMHGMSNINLFNFFIYYSFQYYSVSCYSNTCMVVSVSATSTERTNCFSLGK